MGRLASQLVDDRRPRQLMTQITLHPCPSFLSSDRIVTGVEVRRKERNNLEEWR